MHMRPRAGSHLFWRLLPWPVLLAGLSVDAAGSFGPGASLDEARRRPAGADALSVADCVQGETVVDIAAPGPSPLHDGHATLRWSLAQDTVTVTVTSEVQTTC